MEKIVKLTENFPDFLKRALLKTEYEILTKLEEIRIRAGQPVFLLTGDEEYMLSENGVTMSVQLAIKPDMDKIHEIVLSITENSLYAYMDEMKNGFLTLKGGHRVGICGTAVCDGDRLINISEINSINIRVARELKGISNKLIPYITENGIKNTLIVSPPGVGKTTYLRDLTRNISNLVKHINITLIDERSEVAAVFEGIASNDVGLRTDILNGFKKSDGIIHAIRSMAPAVIAVDEIGSDEDLKAVNYAALSGVKIISTAHASNLPELKEKGILKYFNLLIILKKNDGDRIGEIVCL
ncbi:MAG: stage III sporulation protein AA [Clostridia bacterium]|nr:stage III sporulation protein AA [Clostridia bacterium]